MNHTETLQQLQQITGLTFSIVELTEGHEPWLPQVNQEQGRRESFIYEHQIFSQSVLLLEPSLPL